MQATGFIIAAYGVSLGILAWMILDTWLKARQVGRALKRAQQP